MLFLLLLVLDFPQTFCLDAFNFTHFIAYHIDTDEIRRHVKEIQQELINVDKDFEQYFEKTTSLHVSVDYLRLNESSVEVAKKVLQESASQLNQFKMALYDFNAIFNFFVVVGHTHTQDDILQHNHEVVQKTLLSNGITPGWFWLYIPHMTLVTLTGSGKEKLEHKWDFLLSNPKVIGHTFVRSMRLCEWNIPEGQDDYNVIAEAYLRG